MKFDNFFSKNLKMKKPIYLFIFLLLVICCGTKKGKVQKIIEDGVEVIINHIEPYEVFGTPQQMILELEFAIDTEKFSGRELVSLGSFDVDEEGHLFIFDTKLKKIIRFDNRGNIIGEIGRKGQGPGEFQFVCNLEINSLGEIVATDTRNNKFSFFYKDGRLIKETKIDLNFFEGIILENGNYLFKKFEEPGNDNEAGKYVLSLYDSHFRKIKKLDEVEMFNPLGTKIKGIYFNLAYDVTKDRILTASHNRDYEIYVYNLNGNLIKKIKKEYRKIPPYEIYKKRFNEMFEEGFYNIIKNKLYFPDVLPPFHYFISDNEGRIFVQTYEQGENPGEFMFDIFNPEGIFIMRRSLKDFSVSSGLNGKFISDHFYFIIEKESGFEKLIAYKVMWKK